MWKAARMHSEKPQEAPWVLQPMLGPIAALLSTRSSSYFWNLLGMRVVVFVCILIRTLYCTPLRECAPGPSYIPIFLSENLETCFKIKISKDKAIHVENRNPNQIKELLREFTPCHKDGLSVKIRHSVETNATLDRC
ncbi:hypothetical protein O181_084221 [Austropuccinia psidii MF-1]|uniref:Uncharacterized protein n=1 Tax=Austropuccinia psidii MF-1 TaxID=1389203 RepID=A0A9Q3FW33_9BASI|nr:hypothetical protein [Austropuccinia psidii MF-1]